MIFASTWQPGFPLPLHTHPHGPPNTYVVEGSRPSRSTAWERKSLRPGKRSTRRRTRRISGAMPPAPPHGLIRKSCGAAKSTDDTAHCRSLRRFPATRSKKTANSRGEHWALLAAPRCVNVSPGDLDVRAGDRSAGWDYGRRFVGGARASRAPRSHASTAGRVAGALARGSAAGAAFLDLSVGSEAPVTRSITRRKSESETVSPAHQPRITSGLTSSAAASRSYPPASAAASSTDSTENAHPI